jgi:hypothetical protein
MYGSRSERQTIQDSRRIVLDCDTKSLCLSPCRNACGISPEGIQYHASRCRSTHCTLLLSAAVCCVLCALLCVAVLAGPSANPAGPRAATPPASPSANPSSPPATARGGVTPWAGGAVNPAPHAPSQPLCGGRIRISRPASRRQEKWQALRAQDVARPLEWASLRPGLWAPAGDRRRRVTEPGTAAGARRRQPWYHRGRQRDGTCGTCAT